MRSRLVEGRTEEVVGLARSVYQERQAAGSGGSSGGDWSAAEDLLIRETFQRQLGCTLSLVSSLKARAPAVIYVSFGHSKPVQDGSAWMGTEPCLAGGAADTCAIGPLVRGLSCHRGVRMLHCSADLPRRWTRAQDMEEVQLSSLVCFTGDEAERMSSERDGLVQDAVSPARDRRRGAAAPAARQAER